jgi:hypothetical protein
MRIGSFVTVLALSLLSAMAAAQSAPVAQAFRENARDAGKNLVAAAQTMPADKYSFRPTPAQRSFGEILAHAAQANDYLCGTIGGTKAPRRTKLAPTDSKRALIGRLKETLTFCDQALASLDDSALGEELPFLGGKRTRAAIMTHATGDWETQLRYRSSSVRFRPTPLCSATTCAERG